MQRMVIIGDSLGLPRQELKYRDTYPSLLRQALPCCEIIALNRRANDSALQSTDDQIMDDIISYEPDIVVIHLGIVDCAPRLFTRRQRLIVSALGPAGRFVQRALSARRSLITRLCPKVYVPAQDFRRNMTKLLNAAGQYAQQVLVVGIATARGTFAERSFRICENIDAYNAILSEVSARAGAAFIDMEQEGPSLVQDDGHHLNAEGHRLIAVRITEALHQKPC